MVFKFIIKPQYIQGGVGPPMPPGGSWQQTPQGPVYVTQTTTVTNSQNVDSKTFQSLRTAIPELPMGLAITLCVINCILPGIGALIKYYEFSQIALLPLCDMSFLTLPETCFVNMLVYLFIFIFV